MMDTVARGRITTFSQLRVHYSTLGTGWSGTILLGQSWDEEDVRLCGWEPTPEDGRFWREPVSVTPKYQHLARTTYIGHVWSGESR